MPESRRYYVDLPVGHFDPSLGASSAHGRANAARSPSSRTRARLPALATVPRRVDFPRAGAGCPRVPIRRFHGDGDYAASLAHTERGKLSPLLPQISPAWSKAFVDILFGKPRC